MSSENRSSKASTRVHNSALPRYSADLCSGFLNAPTLADSSKGATTLPVTDKFAVVLATVSRDRTLSHHHTCTEQAKLLFAIRSTGNDLVYLAVGLLFRLTLSLYWQKAHFQSFIVCAFGYFSIYSAMATQKTQCKMFAVFCIDSISPTTRTWWWVRSGNKQVLWHW